MNPMPLPCPSCGQPSAGEACGACGAQRSPRIALTTFRWLALALALAGLVALRQAALARELPVTAVGQVDAALNGAYVRVAGRVTRPPRYDPATEALTFSIDDGSGALRVAAYRQVVRELVAAGQVPQVGDRVDLAGSLRVRQSEDDVALTLYAPEELHIMRASARTAALGALGPADALERVHVRGRVVALRRPVPGLLLLGLRDETGRLDLAIGSEVAALYGPLPALAPGDAVSVTAAVTLYDGGPQLALGAAADLVRLPAESVWPEPVALAALGPADAGRWVRVRGTLATSRAFSGGLRYTLSDDSGELALVLWDSVLSGRRPAEGAAIEALAVVGEYRGRLELVPELPGDLLMPAGAAEAGALPVEPPEEHGSATPGLPGTATPARTPARTPTPRPRGSATPPRTPAPTRSPAPPLRAIAALAAGEPATVEGEMLDAHNFSGGFKFVLADETGRVWLLLWQDDYVHVPGVAGLRPGARVRVSGQVQLYDGALELIPAGGRDVVVLTPGEGPDVAPRVIRTITGADVNTLQAVAGQVVDVKPFSSGVRVYVDDGSGSIEIVLWKAVWDSLPGRERIAPGIPLAATGLVSVYRGRVQLVPALPSYVVIRP
jgi:DNA/RNA endonuclease YhcR with UshA esterase domain